MSYRKVVSAVISSFSMLSAIVTMACESNPRITGSLQGKVLVDPVCPVVQVDKNCDARPLQTNLAIFNAQGALIQQVSSDTFGNFSIKLAPGIYILKSAQEANEPPFLKEPQTVTLR
jgi:hypothetical protein